jgi:hypothetical protein
MFLFFSFLFSFWWGLGGCDFELLTSPNHPYFRSGFTYTREDIMAN